MKLSKPIKLAVAAATVWPFVYFVLFMATIATSFFWMLPPPGSKAPGTGPFLAFGLLFAAHFVTMFLTMALLLFYIVFLFKTDRVRQDKKALWAAVLFLGNMFAMPVFFYIYVWPEAWPSGGDQDHGTDTVEPGRSA